MQYDLWRSERWDGGWRMDGKCGSRYTTNWMYPRERSSGYTWSIYISWQIWTWKASILSLASPAGRACKKRCKWTTIKNIALRFGIFISFDFSGSTYIFCGQIAFYPISRAREKELNSNIETGTENQIYLCGKCGQYAINIWIFHRKSFCFSFNGIKSNVSLLKAGFMYSLVLESIAINSRSVYVKKLLNGICNQLWEFETYFLLLSQVRARRRRDSAGKNHNFSTYLQIER